MNYIDLYIQFKKDKLAELIQATTDTKISPKFPDNACHIYNVDLNDNYFKGAGELIRGWIIKHPVAIYHEFVIVGDLIFDPQSDFTFWNMTENNIYLEKYEEGLRQPFNTLDYLGDVYKQIEYLRFIKKFKQIHFNIEIKKN